MPHRTAPSYKDKLRYRFDNFMSKGGKSIFMGLFVFFLAALIAVALIRLTAYSATPGGDERESQFFEQIYVSWLQMTDPGNMAQDIKSNGLFKFAAIVAGAAGVVILSMLIGLITTALDQKLQELRKGHSKVIENEHTLILGWSEQRVIEILKELIMANESEDNPSVVILAEEDKEKMDDFLGLMLPDSQNTRIVTRSGSPSSITNLEIAAVDRCRSAIVLATAAEESSEDLKALSDARVIKTIMAIVAARNAGDELNIVAEIFDEEHRSIVQDNSPFPVAVANASEILAKIIVQTSRSVGLSVVYSELLSFDGCEMYFYNDPAWEGLTSAALPFYFPDGVPIGIRSANGELSINPDPDRKMLADDEILIVADDDSTIEFQKAPLAAPTGRTLTKGRLKPEIEDELFIGWNRKGAIMVREYADYVVDGSSIDIITDSADDQIRAEIAQLNAELPGLRVELHELNPLIIRNLASLEPEKRNNIILLSNADENADPEEVDSRTVMILLLLRRVFNDAGERLRNTQLITEVMDSTNQALVSRAGVRDFIISDRLISMILAQMSEEAGIKRVYDDLFSEDGSEIYLKPLSLYHEGFPLEITFADCIDLARQREETCIGVKIKSKESDASENYGVTLIPEKNTSYRFDPEDCLVVVAEDET